MSLLAAEPENVVASHKTPACESAFAELARPLPGEVDAALAAAGIERLYTHQAEAADLLRDGHHTVVATSTASGKTLCYHVPVLEALLDGATALYMSPTKALAHDQLRQVNRLQAPWVTAATYDGDTPTHLRAAVRRNANLILTNPDMLHFGILPHHTLWRGFLSRLRYVVVDEAHHFRGIFGSHVALVIRRLRRLSPDIVFALASATIGNPAEHASALTGVDVEAVTRDGAPSGERTLLVWNPPPDENGLRPSSNTEAARVIGSLAGEGAKTLAFSKSRIAAELVAKYARDRLDGREIAAYRAGLLASERREVEQQLQDGSLAAVSATNALELGIDIGDLDAVVLNGFPGTVASFRQQAGRAGRSGQPSTAVFVAQDEPLDQHYANNPEKLWTRPAERALVNPSNPYILGPHLGCAAFEQPLDPDEEIFAPALVEQLAADAVLRERRGRYWWALRRPPAGDVDIRSAGGRPYRIVEASTGRLVGTTDAARAFQDVHPGAVYLHQGDTYRVLSLEIEDRVALVMPHRAPEYTSPGTDSDLVVLEIADRRPLRGTMLYRGLVEVTDRVTGYRRKKLPHGEVIETVELDLPPVTLRTHAVWFTLPERVLADALGGRDLDTLLGSLHAAEHAAIGILPAFAMCDRWDIGGLSTNLHPDTGEPTVFVYDGYPMGAGITEHAYGVAEDHLRTTMDHVAACPCKDGCPSCVQSPKCGNYNEPLHKAGAVEVLRLALGL